jgi:hypothetical protein
MPSPQTGSDGASEKPPSVGETKKMPPPPDEQVPGAGPTAVSRGELTIERIKEDWDGLVEDVRQSQPTLGIFLKGVSLVALEGRVLKLGFVAADRFPMSQVAKNRETIEKISAQKWGQHLRFECVVEEETDPQKQQEEAPPQADPTVKSVLETFDGELV